MEFKIWSKGEESTYFLIRCIVIVLLFVLLGFYIFKYNACNKFLITFNRNGYVLNEWLWVAIVKFILHTLHILINFCIVLVITRRLRYSLIMASVAFAVFVAKMITVLLRDNVGEMPMQLPLYIDVVLLFFIAGYILSKRTHEQKL